MFHVMKKHNLFCIIFLKFHFRNLVELRKTWPLLLHYNRRRILPIFRVNYFKKFMATFRLNLVKKNDVTLPYNDVMNSDL